MEILEKIKETVKKEVDLFQIDLIDVELKGKPGSYRVSVFIDTDTGITIDQCSEFSNRLITYQVLDPLLGENYKLEVSSPGVNRPLKSASDFKRKLGMELSILYEGQKEKKEIKGKLIQVSSDTIKILSSNEEVVLPIKDIIRATQALPW